MPFGLAPKDNVQVQIEYYGRLSDPMPISVAEAAPAVFLLDQPSPHGGRAAALNQDGSINSQDNPAPLGSIVTLYMTRAGQMEPPALLSAPDTATMKGLRDRAILAVLLGCGLRRSEVAALTLTHVQQRDGRWCLVDLVGKHSRVRTVPMPTWVKVAIDAWTSAAGLADGRVFRPVNRGDKVQGEAMSEKVVWQMLQQYAIDAGVPGIAPHDCRRLCAKLCRAAGGELEQIQLLLGHASIQTTERYLGTKQDLVNAPNDAIKLRVAV